LQRLTTLGIEGRGRFGSAADIASNALKEAAGDGKRPSAWSSAAI